MIKKFDEFIKESYNNLGLIKSRSKYYMINESQESKSQSEAKKYIRDNNKFNWSESEINDFIRVKLRNDITSLRDKQIGKFTLGVTRMYFNNEITDASTISKLNSTLKLLSAHLNEYDRNLNGLSANELISKFEQTRENNVKKEKNEINRMKFGVSDYEIVRIDSFSEAKKYYSYTNPHSRWCLTHMDDMFDSYTCDGINQIYFCLKHGFEDVKQIKGENSPLDEYGLSMLSIIVNEEGELAYCTTRWNHANGGNDSAMDAVEISKVVNVNFYEVFKPNTKWKDMVDNAKNRLENGELPENVFDNCIRCKNGNIIVSIIIKKNHDYEYNDDEYDDEYDDEIYKYNIINKDGNYLFNTWVDHINDYVGDYAKVKLNNKYNFINADGKYLSDKWFDNAWDSKDGYAIVVLNNKSNFINTDGEILSDEWFDNAWDFNDGYARVYLKGKYNFINKNGEILSDEWFDTAYNFNDGYARVYLKGKFNFINTDCEILSDEWFDDAWDFKDGYAKVELNGKYNFINKNGEILSDEWFDDAYIFNDGYAKVELYGKGYNFINKNGEILSDEWFDDAYSFKDGYTKVELNGKYNFISTNGEILSDEWFDNAYNCFKDGYVKVKLNGEWGKINTKGEFIPI